MDYITEWMKLKYKLKNKVKWNYLKIRVNIFIRPNKYKKFNWNQKKKKIMHVEYFFKNTYNQVVISNLKLDTRWNKNQKLKELRWILKTERMRLKKMWILEWTALFMLKKK